MTASTYTPEAKAERIIRAILLKVSEELGWPNPHAARHVYADMLNDMTPLFEDMKAELEEFFDEQRTGDGS